MCLSNFEKKLNVDVRSPGTSLVKIQHPQKVSQYVSYAKITFKRLLNDSIIVGQNPGLKFPELVICVHL